MAIGTRELPKVFQLLCDAQDVAAKGREKVWAYVTHCPGFVFEVYPGGRTIKRPAPYYVERKTKRKAGR